jgi:hypothetical protein
MGQFNKTLARGISFNHAIDSVKLLKFIDAKEVLLRSYFNHINNSCDSSDISVKLKMPDENEITIHRN